MMQSTKFSDAQRSALYLAFACFMADIGMTGFTRLSIEEKVAFARDNAGLSPDQLADALDVIGAHASAHADAPRRYEDSHGHA